MDLMKILISESYFHFRWGHRKQLVPYDPQSFDAEVKIMQEVDLLCTHILQNTINRQ